MQTQGIKTGIRLHAPEEQSVSHDRSHRKALLATFRKLVVIGSRTAVDHRRGEDRLPSLLDIRSSQIEVMKD